MMGKTKLCSLFVGGGKRPAQQRGENGPKPVLRMGIIKAGLSGFRRRHGAQDQNFALGIVNRRQGMKDGLQERHLLKNIVS